MAHEQGRPKGGASDGNVRSQLAVAGQAVHERRRHVRVCTLLTVTTDDLAAAWNAVHAA